MACIFMIYLSMTLYFTGKGVYFYFYLISISITKLKHTTPKLLTNSEHCTMGSCPQVKKSLIMILMKVIFTLEYGKIFTCILTWVICSVVGSAQCQAWILLGAGWKDLPNFSQAHALHKCTILGSLSFKYDM